MGDNASRETDEEVRAVLSSAGDAAWLAAITVSAVLFCSPVIAAALRRTENMGLVVLLAVFGVPTAGVTWFVAWYMVFALPRVGTGAVAACRQQW